MKLWRTDDAALRLWVAATIATLVVAAHQVSAQSAAPASRDFSRAGLERISDYIKNEIATGKIPGAIVLIQQHGKPVYFENSACATSRPNCR
jgi:hypothetical protein